MPYLLDTNVLSELRKRKRCDPSVAKWQSGVSAAACFVSVVSLMEIVHGIEAVKKCDAAFAEVLDDWYQNQVLAGFRDRALPVNLTIAARAGRIMAIRTRNTADCLLAATAFVHGLTLVTRNVEDFADTGVSLCNPFTGSLSG